MKQVLHRTVGIIVLAIGIVSYFVPVKGMAAEKNSAPHYAPAYDVVLKNLDTTSVSPDFKVIRQSDESTLGIHFIIQKTGSADLASANITADFTIGSGFVSLRDALDVANLVIDKIKAGTAPSISKAELAAAKIHFSN